MTNKARCRRGIHLGLLVATLWSSSPAGTQRGAGAAETNSLGLVHRSIVQEQGEWQVDYRLRHDGASGLIVSPEEVVLRVEGWVSNSRAAGHATPRWSSLTISGSSRLQAFGDVIVSDDEESRCRERASVRIWVEDEKGAPVGRALEAPVQGSASARDEPPPGLLSVAPGGTIRLRLRLEHQHVVYGAYDPLLGLRTVELRLGPSVLHDVLATDQEQYVAQPRRASFEVPEDQRDTQYYRSGPDSLHVAAHLPGSAYFRFAEIPVRHDTKMRLRFSYLVAVGTEGTCRARITQFKDSPIAWKVLSDGRRDVALPTVGHWTQVEVFFRTEPRATTLALDFRIDGDDVEVGEFWIDDLSLEPVGAPPVDP